MKVVVFLIGFFCLWTQAALNVYTFDSDKQQQQFDTLIHTLRCPKCPNNDLADSNSLLASDIKDSIYQSLQTGQSEDEIIDYLISSYGEFITYRPRQVVVWWLPIGVAAVVFIAALWGIRKKRQALTSTISKTPKTQTNQPPRVATTSSKRWRYAGVVALVFVLATGGFIWRQQATLDWWYFRWQHQSTILTGLFDKQYLDDYLKKMLVAGKADEARAVCFAMQQRVQPDFTDKVTPLANLANCHWQTGQWGAAQQVLSHALRSHPNDGELNYLAAALDFNQKQTLSAAALDRLLRTLQANPAHAGALWLLLSYSVNQGDNEQARFFIAQLRLLKDSDTQMLEALDSIEKRLNQTTESTP